MKWTHKQLFPERYEARRTSPLAVATVVNAGMIPSQDSWIVKEKSEWKLIDQGVQPRRVIRLED